MTPIPDLPPSQNAAFAIDMTGQPTLLDAMPDPALFDAPSTPSGTSVEPTGRKTATKTKSKRPSWTALDGRDKCATCVTEVAGGTRWLALTARAKRVHEGIESRLCYEHAKPVRDADDAETARLKIQKTTRGRAA